MPQCQISDRRLPRVLLGLGVQILNQGVQKDSLQRSFCLALQDELCHIVTVTIPDSPQ